MALNKIVLGLTALGRLMSLSASNATKIVTLVTGGVTGICYPVDGAL